MRRKLSSAVLCILLMACWNGRSTAAGGPTVNYSRDIKPILAAHCYACHGPDEGRRKAKLRLDERASALKKAIKPGDAAHSSLIERIASGRSRRGHAAALQQKGETDGGQIDLLRRWVEQGARFDTHWAYLKPVRPTPPKVQNKAWVHSPLDQFIAAKHERLGHTPASEADRITLIRRLHFDLIGLPPTPEEVDAFVNDSSANAYEKVVDRLLASPHFGERMAVYWLDLVRYADTGGYHSDNHRDITLYRDWVIDAFNQNERFDQFTIEQLAGDLLPHPTREQKIASGYNRLLQTTEEGGAQAKEYTAKYAADRVRNAASVWLATTLGCCECHNHKFDPFTMKDFYSLGAFFADVKERAVGRQEQTVLPIAGAADAARPAGSADRRFAEELAKPTLAVEVGQSAWEERMRSKPAEAARARRRCSAGRAGKTHAATARQRWPIITEPSLRSWPACASRITAVGDAEKATSAAMPKTLVTEAVAPRVMRSPAARQLARRFGTRSSPPPCRARCRRWKWRAGGPIGSTWRAGSRRADNPLTARVFVNRLWKITFGRGHCQQS